MTKLILCTTKSLALILVIFMNFSALAAGEAIVISPEDLQRIRNVQAECLSCHTEAGLAKEEHKDIEPAKMQGLFVEKKAFEASSHGRVDCLACHVTGYKEYPHFEQSKSVINNCDECHTRLFMKIEEQYVESVHHKQMKQKFSCNTCHDPHIFRKASKFETIQEAVVQDNGMCVQCHGITASLASIGSGRQADLEEIHSWLPNQAAHWAKVRCVDCHTDQSPKAMSHNIKDAKGAERNCVNCHQVDSALRLRQYAHLVETERQKFGFLNSVILNESYVVGATRNRYLDLAFGIIAILVIAGIGIHSLARLVARNRRRNHND